MASTRYLEIRRESVTTNEAGVSEDLVLLLFLTPQVCECVDDDTKDEVQDDDDDDEEEEQVVDDAGHKQRLLGKKTRHMTINQLQEYFCGHHPRARGLRGYRNSYYCPIHPMT